MKPNKPDTLCLMNTTFERERRYHLSLCIIGGFILADTPMLLDEKDFMEAAGNELGKTDILDMSMPKPHGEALLSGKCHAPEGKHLPASQVRFRVGTIDKTLNVFGNRFWKRAGGAVDVVTDPEPFAAMPVTYENAFGGPDFKKNPAGKGMAPVVMKNGNRVYPLPNIETPNQLIGATSDRPDPAGFGPLDPGLPRRTKKLGTFDDEWRQDSWPYYPKDLDWSYFNAAPPDQWIDGYFSGNERVSVVNMHPKRQVINSQLPGVRARCFVNQEKNGEVLFREIKTNLDTVWLLPGAETGLILFHGAMTVADDEASDILDILAAWEPLSEAPKPPEYYRELLSGEAVEAPEAEVPEAEEAGMPGIPKLALGIPAVALPGIAAADTGKPKTPETKLPVTPDIEVPEIAGKPSEAPGEQAGAVPAGGAGKPGIPQGKPPAADESALDKFMRSEFEKQAAESEKQFKDLLKKAGVENPDEVFKPKPEDMAFLKLSPEELKAEGDKRAAELEFQARAMMQKAGVENPDQYFQPKPEDLALLKLSPEELKTEANIRAAKQEAQFKALMQKAGVENPDKYFPPEPEGFSAKLFIQSLGGVVPPDVEKELYERERMFKLLEEQKAKMSGEMDIEDEEDVIPPEVKKETAVLPNLPKETPKAANDLLAGLKDGVSFQGQDLTGFDLSGKDLTSIDLKSASLDSADLSGSNLTGADMTGAVLEKADISGADLSSANLYGAMLAGAALAGACLAGVKFTGGDASGASFVDADLKGADFSYANVSGADFTGADLTGANLEYADFSKAKLAGVTCCRVKATGAFFTEADVSGADFTGSDLSQSYFSGAVMTKANFSHTILQSAWFSKASAEGGIFTEADMQKSAADSKAQFPGADFSGANLSGANWEDTDLSGAVFHKASLENAAMMNCNLSKADFTNASATSADFSKSDLSFTVMADFNFFKGILRKANLTETDFRGSNLYGVDFYKANIVKPQFEGANLNSTILAEWRPEQ
ncbi:DUF2169 domain-containing protein [bacterium]|nr:DUF2169 domain-containing protein [bacterium]